MQAECDVHKAHDDQELREDEHTQYAQDRRQYLAKAQSFFHKKRSRDNTENSQIEVAYYPQRLTYILGDLRGIGIQESS